MTQINGFVKDPYPPKVIKGLLIQELSVIESQISMVFLLLGKKIGVKELSFHFFKVKERLKESRKCLWVVMKDQGLHTSAETQEYTSCFVYLEKIEAFFLSYINVTLSYQEPYALDRLLIIY